jgi:PKD repeat protein
VVFRKTTAIRCSAGGMTFQQYASTNDTVFDLKISQNYLWVGGKFTSINNKQNKFISRINRQTNVVDSVNGTQYFIGTGVKDIEEFNNEIYICGTNLQHTLFNPSSGVYKYNGNQFAFMTNDAFSVCKLASNGYNIFIIVYDPPSNSYKQKQYSLGSWINYNSISANSFSFNNFKYTKSRFYIVGNNGVYENGALISNENVEDCIFRNGVMYFSGTKFLSYSNSTFSVLGNSNGNIKRLEKYQNSIYLFGSYDSINGQLKNNVTKYVFYQPPIASFNQQLNHLCDSGSATFTNTSTGDLLSYQWEFQGGTPSTSTATNPSVYYTSIGSFYVKLKVTNPAGADSVIANNIVQVFQSPPIPTITRDSNTLISSPCNNYLWIKNGINQNSEVFQTINPTNGVWRVSTIENGCISSSQNYNFQFHDTLVINGIEEVKFNKEKVIQYFDLQGKKVGNNFSDLISGIYIAEIKVENQTKFIKVRKG